MRSGDAMRAFPQDLRYALRSLLKHPAYAIVAVLTLAVGVGANTAIFSVLHAVVLRDLPYRDADRLALLWSVSLRQHLPDGSSYFNVRDWKEQSRTFEAMAVYRRPEFTRATITGGPDAARVYAALVGPGFFDVLGSPPLLGRTFERADFEGDRAVVISHRLWRQRFGGDARAIGRSIEVNGTLCEIVGVMSSEFTFPTTDVELWRPISVMGSLWEAYQSNPRSRGADALGVIARLSPTSTFASAQTEMSAIAARLREQYPQFNADRGILVERLTDRVVGPRTESALWLLFGAVGFVLLIACANVANLALGRAVARQYELSLRIALGASWQRLMRQALAESLVLAALAAGVGVLFAAFVMAALRTLAAGSLPRLEGARLDVPVFLFALGVSLACGLLAGLMPASAIARANAAETLREGGPRSLGGRSSRRTRQALVVAEIALAVVLLTGAGLLMRSFLRIQSADRGFDSQNVLLLQIDLPDKYDPPALTAAYFNEALARIRALPGVVAAGAVTDFFIQRQADQRITLEGQPAANPDDPAPPLIRDQVIPGYFEAMRIPLRRGRLLQDSDLAPNAPRVGVINEAMARAFWPGQDPVGKRLRWGRDAQWTTVVGVIADMRRQRLDEPAIPSMFGAGISDQMDVAVRTAGDPERLRESIRAELRALEPTAPPFGIITVEQRLGETVAVRTLQTLLLGALAAAALVLAVIGVYGIVHQSVVARTPEIGIRMALGATQPSVAWMVLSSALALAGAGLFLGAIGAFALAGTIASFLYETSPLDPLIYASVAVLLLAVTTLACLAPTRRAAGIDPLVALRHD
jgi:predicted permease